MMELMNDLTGLSVLTLSLLEWRRGHPTATAVIVSLTDPASIMQLALVYCCYLRLNCWEMTHGREGFWVGQLEEKRPTMVLN